MQLVVSPLVFSFVVALRLKDVVEPPFQYSVLFVQKPSIVVKTRFSLVIFDRTSSIKSFPEKPEF